MTRGNERKFMSMLKKKKSTIYKKARVKSEGRSWKQRADNAPSRPSLSMLKNRKGLYLLARPFFLKLIFFLWWGEESERKCFLQHSKAGPRVLLARHTLRRSQSPLIVAQHQHVYHCLAGSHNRATRGPAAPSKWDYKTNTSRVKLINIKGGIVACSKQEAMRGRDERTSGEWT